MARPIGVRSRVTIEREERAKAEIAAAIRGGRAAGKADPRAAMDEIYRLHALAEGVAAKLRPRDIVLTENGFQLLGGDWQSFGAFGEWVDRLIRLTELMAKYQLPPIRAMELPSAKPTPEELEKGAHIRFGLRVFEGGKQVEPLQPLEPFEDEDDE